jgi:HK97 family phage major capsid protein
MDAALKKAIDDLGQGFETFKAANDERLAKIEKDGHAPADLEAKVDAISNDLTVLQGLKDRVDTIEAAGGRLNGGGGDADNSAAKAAHTKAFGNFFRKGVDDGLRDLEVQAGLTTQSDPDGGFLTPEEIDTEITRVMGTVSAMRMLARVQPVGSATYKKLHNVGGTSSGWVGEEEVRTETDTPQLKQLDFPTMELYANPAATQGMLDDSQFDIESWLASEVAIEFTEQEGAAFITGNGVNKPRGFLSYTNVVDSAYAWGGLGWTVSGAAGAFVAAPNGADCLIDLQHTLKRGYRNNAKFLMADTSVGAVRKLKDSSGTYLWRAGIEEGASETLLSKPLEVDDNMPVMAANSLSIAYGDFNRGYVITDRMGVRVLRDPYTNKPFVQFYTTKRVGGGVQDFAAIKLVKFAA